MLVKMTVVVFIYMLTLQLANADLSLKGSTSYIASNTDFVLTCSFDITPELDRVRFYKDGTTVVRVTNQAGYCILQNIVGNIIGDPILCSASKNCDCNYTSYSWTFNGNIEKANILFACDILISNDPSIYMNSTLLVSRATVPLTDPSIVQQPDSPINYNGTVSLTCEVTGGNPLAVLAWECPIFSVVTLTPTISTDRVISTIEMVVNSTDNGKTCVCIASHPLWKTDRKSNKTIVVYYPPVEPLLLSLIPNDVLKDGTPVNATCFLKGGNPLVNMILTCNGQQGTNVDTDTTAYSILVFTVNESFNGKQCVCTATQPVGTFAEVVRQTIAVQYAPTGRLIITQSPITAVFVNSTITLKCEVTGGNPLAILNWDCNETLTNNTANNTASYSVSFRATKSDNGRICTCTATQQMSDYRISKQHSIVVYYIPDTGLVVTQFPLGPLDTGEEVTLTCNSTGGNPLAELNWDCGEHGDIKNNTSGNTSSYSVRFEVNKSYNGKQCNCSATHLVTTYRPTEQHKLNVYYPPSLPSLIINPILPLFEGNSTTLTCHVTDAGNPQSNFTWTWNDTILHTSMQHFLDIGPVDKNDNGAVVSCRVENEYSIKKGDDLQVNTSLNIEYNPIVILEEETYTVVEGQPVNIKCITFGNPTPDALWVQMEERHTIIEGGQELNLTIPDIDRKNKGRYECEAVSKSMKYGMLMTSAYIDLIVNYPPNVSIEYTINGDIEGQATYQCNAEGNPNTIVYTGWTQTYNGIVIRNSEKLKEFTQDNNTKLILRQLTYQDSGNYTCFVTNGIPDRHGEVTQFSKEQLEVEATPELLDKLPPDDTFSTERGGQIVINLRFITFPDIYDAFWYRNTSKLSIKTNTQNGIEANIENTTIEANFHDVVVNVSTYAYHAHLKISNLEEHMEGAYILVLRNRFKDKNVTVFVVISSKPDDPSDLNITRTTSTEMTLSWKRGFSGGHNQYFNVSVFDSRGIRFTELINDNFTVTTQIYTIADLNPSTEYVLQLFSQNKIGQSNVIKLNTTTEAADAGSESNNQDFPVATVVGLLTGILAAVLVIIVIVYMKRRCSLFGKDNEGTGRKKLTALNIEDEDNNGLTDNILYESAGPDFGCKGGPSGAEYAVVTKNKDKFKLNEDSNIQETTLYSEVMKKPKDHQKASVYTNAVNIKKIKNKTKGKENELSEEVYENMSGDVEHNKSVLQERKGKENKDGLVYADLVFNPSVNGPRFIHGEDDRTIYADVDTTQKIDPLPESDGEETAKDEQIKATDK